MAVYYKNTAPLIEYYKKQGKLVTVNGMAPIDEVTKAIAAVVDGAGREGVFGVVDSPASPKVGQLTGRRALI